MPQIWIKARTSYQATPLLGTEGAVNFTWSPDGTWIAFTVAQKLRKVPVVGGAAVELANFASSNPGITWLDDNTIVFLPIGGGLGLRRIPAGGGEVEKLPVDSVPSFLLAPLPARAACSTRAATPGAPRARTSGRSTSGPAPPTR
ncbi:MAG: PD40 domain-containing protein [Gemmatimonadetes bacterium]|nr:PD40 domain-containing protein [Gemmatimonadota bacterium]